MTASPIPGEAGGSYAALARYYDGFTQNMEYEKRTEYLCALLRHALAPSGAISPSGVQVLDLACGTGVYTRALLRHGYDAVGVDASPDMLAIAHERSVQEAAPQPPLLLCQRLEDLDLYGTAQAAVCLTDSLNHLADPRALRRFFRRLRLFLEPGAPFIFDVNTLHKHARVLADNAFVYESGEAYCVWQNRWLPASRTTEIALDIFAPEADGRYTRGREQFAERAYTPEELTRWLRKAGFAVEHIYGELTWEPPQADAQRIFFIARRI